MSSGGCPETGTPRFCRKYQGALDREPIPGLMSIKSSSLGRIYGKSRTMRLLFAPMPSRKKVTLELVFVAVFVRYTTKFCGGWQYAKNVYYEESQPLLLSGAEARVTRLPRIGKPFELGRPLSQCVNAVTHELDRLTGPLLTEPRCRCHADLPSQGLEDQSEKFVAATIGRDVWHLQQPTLNAFTLDQISTRSP